MRRQTQLNPGMLLLLAQIATNLVVSYRVLNNKGRGPWQKEKEIFIRPLLVIDNMHVHPSPKKRNLGCNRAIAALPNAEKLKRLPHVFARALELPFRSDPDDVLVQETPDSFRFIASREDMDITDDFRAHVIEIFPGVTKTVIRRSDQGGGVVAAAADADDGDDDIDIWRFRLPAATRPDMASARCIGRQLVVTIPKAVNLLIVDGDKDDGRRARSRK